MLILIVRNFFFILLYFILPFYAFFSFKVPIITTQFYSTIISTEETSQVDSINTMNANSIFSTKASLITSLTSSLESTITTTVDHLPTQPVVICSKFFLISIGYF
jgi:hypothetical protein